jgi:cysteine desulfurase
VLEAMMPYLREGYGNASSIHSSGQRARSAVDEAREQVAALIGAKASEVVFTSGGTEADNLAIFGVVGAARRANHAGARPFDWRTHVVTTAIEHHAVLHACGRVEVDGGEVSFVAPGADGIVNSQKIREAMRPETVLISVMHANNELGTIQPVAEIGRMAREAGVAFHTDAVQSVGKIRVNVGELNADLLSLSAHKIYGPKGVGALYVKTGTNLEPQFCGGHHERDLRPGTENVAGIVGFGKAAELARERMKKDAQRIGELRDRFEQTLTAKIPDCKVNGSREKRTPNTSNITFQGAEGESLVIALDLRGVECSTGAACSSGAVEPSHVLTAIGLTAEEGRSSVRFSLGSGMTDAEIDYSLSVIPTVVQHLRELSPRYTPVTG